MHLLIPFASVRADDDGHGAFAAPPLPRLASLLARLEPEPPDDGDEWSLTPPHERALARELGLAGADGQLPWAAHEAALDGLETGDLAWARLTPVHWQVGADRVTLADPDALGLDEAESRELMATLAPLFESDGLVLLWGAPLRWYAAHESFAEMACASLDRVIGRNLDRWLPEGPATRRIRRLQMEAQMLWHTHPVNDRREARGALPVNSFWVSGCGARQPARATASLRVAGELRPPALAGDAEAWRRAWSALDDGPVREALARADRGGDVALTLCGERRAQRFATQPRGAWSRLASRWRRVEVGPVLEAL